MKVSQFDRVVIMELESVTDERIFFICSKKMGKRETDILVLKTEDGFL